MVVVTERYCFYSHRRTDIRRRLGSAKKGQLNYTTLYIAWLLAAVLYHVPALSALGIDTRADLSLSLTGEGAGRIG